VILTDEELNDILNQFRLAASRWRGDTAIVVSPRAFLAALNYFERQHELRNRHEPPASTDA
jgi:hypothetical protein